MILSSSTFWARYCFFPLAKLRASFSKMAFHLLVTVCKKRRGRVSFEPAAGCARSRPETRGLQPHWRERQQAKEKKIQT